MQKSNFLRSVALAMGLCGFMAVGLSHAQDEKKPAATAKAAVEVQAAGKAKALANSTNIQLDGGKLIVIDQDGKEREIDVGDAKSVVIRRSAQSQVVDGETIVARVSGKAIVVGPDGVVQEIEIEGPGGAQVELPQFQLDLNIPDEVKKRMMMIPRVENFDFQPFQRGSWEQASVGKHFIGVHCDPIDEALRSHLGLEAGKGLIINQMTPDSPAEKAGLKNHDILLYAGEKPLSEVADLVAVINEAGEGGLIVELGIIRAGKEMSIEVTPEERRGQNELYEAIPNENFMRFEFQEDQDMPRVFRVMPGLIRAIDPEQLDRAREELQTEVEKLRANAELLKRGVLDDSVREEMQRLREEMQKVHEEFRQAREEMLKSLQEMKRLLPSSGEGG